MIRLIATDIDGTLLDSDNSVPDAHRRALAEAVERGVLLALVTARKRDSSMAVARALELPCACISHNGARTWDWNGNELRHLKLDLGLAREIVTFADQRELPLVVTIDERNYYDRRYPMSPSLLGSDERIEASLIDILTAEPTRIIAAGGKIDDLVDAFSAAHDSIQVHRYYSRSGSIASAVVTHPRAVKEDALAELAGRAGIAAHSILALGDAEADAGVLQWAGVGVAVANAMPEALAAADWIAPPNDEGGLAVAVQRFVLDIQSCR
jgi:Cof subfamily protein (haloacid dehalogenase superfamily)